MRWRWVPALLLSFQLGVGCDITNRESAYRNMIKDQQLLLKAQQAGDLSRQEELLKDLITCGEFLKLDTSFYKRQLVAVKQLKNNPKGKGVPILKPKEELKGTALQLEIQEQTTYPVDKVIKIRHRTLAEVAGEKGGEGGGGSEKKVGSSQTQQGEKGEKVREKGGEKVGAGEKVGGKVGEKSGEKLGFGKVLKSWPEILLAFPNRFQVRHFQITGSKFKEVFDLTPAKVEKPYFKTLPNRTRLKVAQFKPGVVRVVVEGKERFKLYSRVGDGVLELGFKPFKKKLKKSPLLKSSSEEGVQNYRERPLAKKLTKAQKRGKVIVIDPGHGGKDPGGVGYRKIKEKEIVLGIAKYLAQILRKRGYQVYLTRARDRFIQLKERTRFANQKKADLFISIHGNIAYHHNPRLRGIEVYYLSPTKNERAIRVAMEENKEIKGLNYLDQRVILNFLNKDRIVASHKFGIDVLNGIYSALRRRYPVRKNGVRGGPFWVLVGTQMPSILIEVGYLTNPTDAKLLKNPKFQQRLAAGIADGIEAYFRKNR